MDVSSLGSLSNISRAKEVTSYDSVETNKSSSKEIQGQGSQEALTRTIPPLQAPSDLSDEEGSVVNQDNSSSTNIKGFATDSESGSQVDVLA